MIACSACRHWIPTAEGAGKITIVTARSGHGRIANNEVAFNHDEVRAHGFGVRTLFLRGIIDRNELAARFESLVQQIIQHDATQSIFRHVRVSERLSNEVIATLLGTGGPANELQLVNGLNLPRTVQRAPSIDQMDASIL